MWENLYRQWELQEDIYRKLGRPQEAARKITKTDRLNSIIYGGVCLTGTLAYAIQFFYTPKYALNTYAIVPWDNLPLQIIFCLHECMFLCHGYIYQAFTMVLAECYSVSYQHLLEEMNKALASIIINKKTHLSVSKLDLSQVAPSLDKRTKCPAAAVNINYAVINPKMRAPETEYDIESLIFDYKKVMISAQFHNQWIGFIMGFPELISYGQFVSDVFNLIQLLKEPETDYFGVFFYIMDAAFGMIMIFRMLIILSRLYPQADEFIHGIKIYSMLNTPLRKKLLKIIPSLRIVSAKLTGYTIRPGSVPIGVNILINWYIAAAMWQRPEDPNRRT